MTKTYGYIRVSTDLQDVKKNRSEILEFANKENLGKVLFVEETVSGTKSYKKRDLALLVDKLKNGDTLITNELSRLGRSMRDILELLDILTHKKIKVYAIKNGWRLDNTPMSKMTSTMLALFSEIERDLISQRTKEALNEKKKQGIKLGRPVGFRFSKLDKFEKNILKMINDEIPQKVIARKFDCTQKTLTEWLKKRNLNKKSRNNSFSNNE